MSWYLNNFTLDEIDLDEMPSMRCANMHTNSRELSHQRKAAYMSYFTISKVVTTTNNQPSKPPLQLHSATSTPVWQ